MNKKCYGLMVLLMAMTVESFATENLSVVAAGARVERLCGGFEFTEGPAVDAEGNVFFTDQPNNRIYKWSVDGELSIFHDNPGRANGLYFDKDGNLLACADLNNELWLIDMQGRVTVLVRNYQGKKLNGPNDLWIDRKGGIYFTDPFYHRPYWNRGPMEQDGQHVYYLTPDHNELIRVTTDLMQPNGIIGTPDGKLLYVADIGTRKTFVYRIGVDGRLLNKKLFCLMPSDGMTIDNEGNVYLTGLGITVFNKYGKRIENINVPAFPTANVTFGGKDRKTLFITAQDGLYGLRMRVKAASIIPDFNSDERVDLEDFSRLAQYWHQNESSVDIGPAPLGDYMVDIQDLIILAEYWLMEVLPVDLVAYWKFDEAKGSIAYNSAGDKDGTLHGDPLWQPANGYVSGTLKFDGLDDYISIPFVLNPGEISFSVTAWIWGGAPGQVIISQADTLGGRTIKPGSTWLGTDALSGKLMTGLMQQSPGSLMSEYVINDDQWHHIGLVYDLSESKRYLYADGTEVAMDVNHVTRIDSEAGLYIGIGQALDPVTFFSGLIDDVRIYDTALSAENVVRLANQAISE